MAEYLVQTGDLTAVANAIREKGGTSELLQFPDGFVSAVAAIETNSGSDAMALLVQGQLTELTDSRVTGIGQSHLFYQNSGLTLVDLPNAAGPCSSYAFYNNSALRTCRLPKITSLGVSALYGAGITETDFSAVESVEQNSLRNCAQVTRLDFPSLKYINGTNCFNGCSKLATLILRSETMVAMTAANSLYNTLIAGGTGYIYVPRALVSAYQADTVWGGYSAQLRAIEDYPNV